jgi:uncharacterized protein (DUF302 family)
MREVPPFDQAVGRTREILKTEGFGVLSEIRTDGKFKEKLRVDFRNDVILGACNLSLAYQALQEELDFRFAYSLQRHRTGRRLGSGGD